MTSQTKKTPNQNTSIKSRSNFVYANDGKSLFQKRSERL